MANSSRPKVLSLEAAREGRLYFTLMELLESYCMEEADSAERERALDRFFGGDMDFAKLPDSAQAEFIDWFAFSYRTEQTGETMVELFAAEHLTLTGETVPAGLFRSHFSFFEVVEQKSYRLTVTDRLSGESFLVIVEGAPPPPKGSLLCGRLIPVGEGWRPGFSLDTVPASVFPLFQPLLSLELERMRLAFPDATWQDLLRERWPLLRDVMLMRLEHEPQHLDIPALTPAPGSGEATTPGAQQVAMQLQLFGTRAGQACEDIERLIRFWHDAAAVLQPTIRQPLVWAAGAAWAFYNCTEPIGYDKEEIAAEFEVSVDGLTRKARQIADALGVLYGDDRYADPLAPDMRMSRLAHLFGPENMDTLYGDEE